MSVTTDQQLYKNLLLGQFNHASSFDSSKKPHFTGHYIDIYKHWGAP